MTTTIILIVALLFSTYMYFSYLKLKDTYKKTVETLNLKQDLLDKTKKLQENLEKRNLTLDSKYIELQHTSKKTITNLTNHRNDLTREVNRLKNIEDHLRKLLKTLEDENKSLKEKQQDTPKSAPIPKHVKAVAKPASTAKKTRRRPARKKV